MQFLVKLYSVEGLDLEEIFSKGYTTPEYCPYIMDYISFEFFWLDLSQKANTGEFSGIVLAFNLDFFGPMLCSLGSWCNGGCLISS